MQSMLSFSCHSHQVNLWQSFKIHRGTYLCSLAVFHALWQLSSSSLSFNAMQIPNYIMLNMCYTEHIDKFAEVYQVTIPDSANEK